MTIVSCSNLLKSENEEDPNFVLIDKDLVFTMGYSWECMPWNCGYNFERPAHNVSLSPYYIGNYEITNEEYLQFVKADGYTDSSFWSTEGWHAKQGDNPDSIVWTKPKYWGDSEPPWKNSDISNEANCPVIGISWFECEAYCNWLTRSKGEIYRLPTEAEWERAARGPDPGNRYPWGNIWDRNKCNHLAFMSDEDRKVIPVGSYEEGKSYDGCYDLAGNAYEWCYDYLITPASADNYYSECEAKGIVYNPMGPSEGVVRSIRGREDGLYLTGNIELDSEIRSSFRWLSAPNRRPPLPTGFRIVKVVNN